MSAIGAVIVGGGLAGLSLATRLAAAGAGRQRIVVADARREWSRDKTWCFWDFPDNPFRELVTMRWPSVAVADEGGTVSLDVAFRPYCALPADRFYDACLERLAASDNVELLADFPVTSIDESPRGVRIAGARGTLEAEVAFDGRPPAAVPEGMTQCFAGVEVELAEPHFDPRRAMLMDFRLRHPGEVRFLYLLPFSATRALIEDTRIVPTRAARGLSVADLGEAIALAIGDREHRVVFRESGAIPMHGGDRRPQSALGRTIPIGTRAGTVRSSSGYCFEAVQRHSDLIAQRWQRVGSTLRSPECRFSRPWRVQFMDRLFLRVLSRRRDLAPKLFRELFARTPPRRLLGFLSESAGWSDCVSVASSLPPLPFLRELSGAPYLVGAG